MKHYDYVTSGSRYQLFHVSGEVVEFMAAHGIARELGSRHSYDISQLTKRLLDDYLNQGRTKE